MEIEDQVQVKVTTGEECLVCEKKMSQGSVTIEVTFKIHLIITTKEMRYQMHLSCAERLRNILDTRIDEGRAEESA